MAIENLFSSDKVGIVVGVGALGEAVARCLVEQGIGALTVADVAESRALGLAEELRSTCPNVSGLQLDVADPKAVEEFFDAAVAAHGVPDYVVHTAGILPLGTIEETEDDEWQRSIDINLNGTWYVCRRAFLHMKERGSGTIVPIASIAGIANEGGRTGAAYPAAKFGVVGLARRMSVELKQYGMRIVPFCPGPLAGEMVQAHKPGVVESVEARAIDNSLGRPEEAAMYIALVLSDTIRWVTGVPVVLDGGMTTDGAWMGGK